MIIAENSLGAAAAERRTAGGYISTFMPGGTPSSSTGGGLLTYATRLLAEKRKWAEMNETRAAVGLPEIPIPSDAELMKGEVRYVKVGRSGPMVRTTEQKLASTVRSLQAIERERQAERDAQEQTAAEDVDENETTPDARRGRATPVIARRVEKSKDASLKLPLILGGLAVIAGGYFFLRKKKRSNPCGGWLR